MDYCKLVGIFIFMQSINLTICASSWPKEIAKEHKFLKRIRKIMIESPDYSLNIWKPINKQEQYYIMCMALLDYNEIYCKGEIPIINFSSKRTTKYYNSDEKRYCEVVGKVIVKECISKLNK